jgi:hypothetical protein
MTDNDHRGKPRQPRVVRLPGFIRDDEVGLGDVVKRATTLAGIRPCGGCSERAARLNTWVRFTGDGRAGRTFTHGQ